MMKTKLDIHNLSVCYPDKNIVKNLTASLEQGDILGLVGSNGCGKTSLLHTLSGVKKCISGRITINGSDIYKDNISYNSQLGYAPERAPLFYEQSPIKYLKYVADLRNISDHNLRIKDLLLKFNLWQYKDKRISQLSKGVRQRINLAQAILHYPNVLLLDEPSSGLDNEEIHKLHSHIIKHSKHMIVILSSHTPHEITSLCNKILLLDSKISKVMNINDALPNIEKQFSQTLFRNDTGNENVSKNSKARA